KGSTSRTARESASPEPLQRSPKPLSSSVSAAPARPASTSQRSMAFKVPTGGRIRPGQRRGEAMQARDPAMMSDSEETVYGRCAADMPYPTRYGSPSPLDRGRPGKAFRQARKRIAARQGGAARGNPA